MGTQKSWASPAHPPLFPSIVRHRPLSKLLSSSALHPLGISRKKNCWLPLSYLVLPSKTNEYDQSLPAEERRPFATCVSFLHETQNSMLERDTEVFGVQRVRTTASFVPHLRVANTTRLIHGLPGGTKAAAMVVSCGICPTRQIHKPTMATLT